MKKKFVFSVFLLGFTALASQIVLMREFLIVFYGNEISIGFILAAWLSAGAFGSAFLGRFADQITNRERAFTICQLILAGYLPLSIIAIRMIKTVLNLEPGQIMGFVPMGIACFVILIPICTVLGFMFALASRIYETKSSDLAAKPTSVYLLETIGSIFGGLIAGVVLIRFLSALHIMVVLSLLNILLALPVIIFFLGVLLWVCGAVTALNSYSHKMQWQGHELLSSTNSIYGNIAVTKRMHQISFFDNGLHLYSVPDELNAEESVHFALLEHPAPKNILLVGGGAGGLIKEILKHPIERVDYLELDPELIKKALKFLPREESLYLKDSRVQIKNKDARIFIKNSLEKYDCVIIHLGDPYTAQINRYYTVEFFQEVKKILNPQGIICFGLSSSESYINPELKKFLGSIYFSLQSVFADTLAIPGNTVYFLGSAQKGELTYDYNILEERVQARSLDIKYVRSYYLAARLTPEKINYLENALKSAKPVRLNYDFKPVSYYYDIIIWLSRFKGSLVKKFFEAVNERLLWYFLAVLCMGSFLLRRKAVLLIVAVSGFSSLAMQLVILLAFQIIYGYMFYHIGMIFNSFMFGLALGTVWIKKKLSVLTRDWDLFIKIELGIGIFCLGLPLVFKHHASILFYFLSVIIGFLAGAQFPLANKIYLQEAKDVGRISGLIYGIDLLGGCIGAFLTGIYLIPILGLAKTCLFAGIINIAIVVIVGSRNLYLRR